MRIGQVGILSGTSTMLYFVETPEVKEEQKIKNSDELAPLEEVNRSTGPSRVSESALDTKLRVDFQDLTFHKLIGKGSFKSVWRGRWGNTTVAIVSMHKGGMVTEARVLQRLSNHPNMVQFYRCVGMHTAWHSQRFECQAQLPHALGGPCGHWR